MGDGKHYTTSSFSENVSHMIKSRRTRRAERVARMGGEYICIQVLQENLKEKKVTSNI
jgi:hypothetical protein